VANVLGTQSVVSGGGADIREALSPTKAGGKPVVVAPVSPLEVVAAAAVRAHEVTAGACREGTAHKQSRQTLLSGVSPRDFLESLQHLVFQLGSRRETLEDQFIHLSGGLSQLEGAAASVAQLQKELARAGEALSKKEREAEQKLSEILRDTKTAEEQQAESRAVDAQVDEKRAEVETKQATVGAQLGEVEPELAKAQEAVSAIDSRNLNDIRALSKPPFHVRRSIEAVVLLVGPSLGLDQAVMDAALKAVKKVRRGAEKAGAGAGAAPGAAAGSRKRGGGDQTPVFEWPDVRKLLQHRDFIRRVVGLKSEDLPPAVQEAAEGLLADPEFNLERVVSASKTCGPMFKWFSSQVKFASILQSVGPLREEAARLSEETVALEVKQGEIKTKLEELENSLSGLQREYRDLVAETERIRGARASTERRLGRSQSLIDGLGGERHRWSGTIKGLARDAAAIPGAACMASAFLSYAGRFDAA